MIFLKMRTVTRDSGLVLSETVPDNFNLFCAKTNPGRMNKIESKRAGSKNLAMGFVLLMDWGNCTIRLAKLLAGEGIM